LNPVKRAAKFGDAADIPMVAKMLSYIPWLECGFKKVVLSLAMKKQKYVYDFEPCVVFVLM